MIGGVVLDTEALADLAENRTARTGEIVDLAVTSLRVVCVPTAALMECWAQVPERAQAFLALFVGLPVVVVEPLDGAAAVDAGALAAAVDAPDTPAGTLHAVHVARIRQWPLLTADPAAVHRLDPDVAVEALP